MWRVRRVGALALVAALALLIAAGPASAAVSQSTSLTLPSATTAGQNNVAGSFTVRNTNTAPNQAESNNVTSMQLALACGATGTISNTCPTPDPGVFAFSGPATGAAGTACAGTTFTPSAPDASGIVTLTPSAPVVLAAPGGPAGSDSCTVNFTFNVLRVPTIDAAPATPGTQTRSNLRVSSQGSMSMAVVTGTPSLTITVARATPTMSTSATNASLGQPIRDTATVTGAGTPTGTVTFNLYGPGDATCAGPAIFTSTNPIGGGGSATSADFTPTATGSYRWRASYSGDANNLPDSAPCNSPGEISTVGPPDTTAPQTTITAGPTGATNDTTPTFEFSSDEAGSTFTCSIDGGAFAACASPHTTAALGPGAHTFAVRATDSAGNVDTTPSTRTFTVDVGGVLEDRVSPVVSLLSLTNRTFRVGPRPRPGSRRVRSGTAFRFGLSEAAQVSFAIERRTTGRRVGARCRARTRGNRRARPCTRFVKVGSFTKPLEAGPQRVRFPGTLRGRALRPARYRVVVQARDGASNPSGKRTANFRVVR